MNRLAFLAFLQEKGFLDGDRNYLQTYLRQMEDDSDGTSYQSFLSTLFRDGLNAPSHSPRLEQELGKLPYLNIDLFALHPLERKYQELWIPNSAFERLLDFFAQYHWHLDDEVEQGVTDITPETFSRTLENLVNQIQIAVYYTKKDITKYISKNAIIPSLFEKLQNISPDAFSPDSTVWSLLRANFDDSPLKRCEGAYCRD